MGLSLIHIYIVAKLTFYDEQKHELFHEKWYLCGKEGILACLLYTSYENGWIGKAQSREKKYSSYILASGYNKKGKHFSKTCELGTMKKQTGKYFSDSSLLARVRYGMQPTEIWDEHTGKTTYYKKTVKNCKIK